MRNEFSQLYLVVTRRSKFLQRFRIWVIPASSILHFKQNTVLSLSLFFLNIHFMAANKIICWKPEKNGINNDYCLFYLKCKKIFSFFFFVKVGKSFLKHLENKSAKSTNSKDLLGKKRFLKILLPLLKRRTLNRQSSIS